MLHATLQCTTHTTLRYGALYTLSYTIVQYTCYTIVRCTTHARICYSVLRANGFIEWNYNSIRDTIIWIKPSISCFLQLLFWLICFLVPLIMTTMNPCVPRRISARDCQFIIRVIIPRTVLQSNKIKDEFRRKDLTIDQWMILMVCYKGFQLLFWLICFIIPLIMTTMNPCVPGRISAQDRQFIIIVIIPGTMLQSNKIKGKFRRKTLSNSWMVIDERVLYMKSDEMDC